MTEDSAYVTEADLRKLYSLLADATQAHATGDPNACAKKAREAKELVLELSRG